MNKKSVISTLMLVVLAICAIVLYKNYADNLSPQAPLGGETGPGVPAGWYTYSNAKYGLRVSYPSDLNIETTFKSFYALPNTWRVGASADSKGEPIVSIPVYRIDKHGANGAYVSYPLYFDTELRIGASRDPKDVATCLQLDPSYSNIAITTTTINGIVFYEFPLQDAAMMQYRGGESYRTVHDGACIAVEQVKAGSDYRDTTSSDDISDATLDSYYQRTEKILATFRFLPEASSTSGTE